MTSEGSALCSSLRTQGCFLVQKAESASLFSAFGALCVFRRQRYNKRIVFGYKNNVRIYEQVNRNATTEERYGTQGAPDHRARHRHSRTGGGQRGGDDVQRDLSEVVDAEGQPAPHIADPVRPRLSAPVGGVAPVPRGGGAVRGGQPLRRKRRHPHTHPAGAAQALPHDIRHELPRHPHGRRGAVSSQRDGPGAV